LHRFNNDRGKASCRVILKHLPNELEAIKAARRIFHLERTTIAIGIRGQMKSGMKNSPILLKGIANETQDSSCFPMEASPKAEDFKFLGVRLG
jgi:hypothetical protein